MLRAEAYTLPFLADAFDLSALAALPYGVYAYMLASALLGAAAVYFICRIAIGVFALRYGVKIPLADAGLYLVFFITFANIPSALMNILYAANPYIFMPYISLIEFVFSTVGYILFAYCFVNDYVPEKHAKRFFVGLAYLYFGTEIALTAFSLFSGGGL
jgi:hypothetical protein